MAQEISIIVPGDGSLLTPIWRALEAQASLSIALHGCTETDAVLEFVARQFRGAFQYQQSRMGATGSWEDTWKKSGEL